MTRDADTFASTSTENAAGLPAGVHFAGHEIETELGRGGMGVVYRARHLVLDRLRALKVIAPGLSADPLFRERFRRESRLAAMVEHPNVIPVYHAGEEEGRLFIAMRLVDGLDLEQRIAIEGQLTPELARSLIDQCALGLDAAHSAGLVHRDVKPGNVLLEGAPGSERVFVTDFGISRQSGSGGTLTSAGEVLGSPDYVAPEQAERGEATAASDIYSLGAVLYFALTGRPPFERSGAMEKLYAHAHAPRPVATKAAPWLPGAIDDVLARAMATDPVERYVTASDFAVAASDALRGAGQPAGSRRGLTSPSAGSTARTKVLPRRRRRRLLWAAAALLAVGGMAAAVLLLTGDDPSGAPEAPAGASVATKPIPVGEGPTGITVGHGSVWVASQGADAVFGFNPKADGSSQIGPILSAAPRSVATGFGALWLVTDGDSLLRMDVEPPDRPDAIGVGGGASDVATGYGLVWVSNGSQDTVSVIDPEQDTVVRRVPVGNGPRGIAVGSGSVWVTNVEDGTVTQIDPETLSTTGQPIPVGQRPSDLAVGSGVVWAMDNFAGTVQRIDAESLEPVGEPIDVGPKPRGIKVGLGFVWVAISGDDSVVRLDPTSGQIVGSPTEVGHVPADIAVGAGSAWTADSGDASVTRLRPRPPGG